MDTITVLARGLYSSLGDEKTACAAYRAGLNRFSGSKEVQIFNQGDDEPTPVKVAALPEEFGAYQGGGRYTRLFRKAVEPLIPYCQQIGGENISVFIGVPDPYDRALITARDSFYMEMDGNQERLDEYYGPKFQSVLSQLGVNVPTSEIYCLGTEHTAFTNALAYALEHMKRNESAYCIVGAIDCYADTACLKQLVRDEKLITKENPSGFIPGEGAAFYLISNVDQTQGIIFQGAAAFEGDCYSNDFLYECLFELLARQNWQRPDTTLPLVYISDLNGTQDKGYQWGMYMTKVQNTAWLVPDKCWYIAQSFGDTGAASGALSFAVALHGLERKVVPPSTDFMIANLSVEGAHSLLYLRLAAQQGGRTS